MEDVSTVEDDDDSPLPDVVFLDDTTLVTSSVDGSVTFWGMSADAWIGRACDLAGRNLTHDEWDRYVGGPYETTCAQWPSNS
jgi:hypothetical protein